MSDLWAVLRTHKICVSLYLQEQKWHCVILSIGICFYGANLTDKFPQNTKKRFAFG